MDEQTLRDCEWSRALLARVVRLALLRAAYEYAELAKRVQL